MKFANWFLRKVCFNLLMGLQYRAAFSERFQITDNTVLTSGTYL